MNRESFILEGTSRARGLRWRARPHARRDVVPRAGYAQRELVLMASLWLFIGCIAAYDVYLSIKYQAVLKFLELNPLGRWLMELDDGSVAVFMGCKFLGTLLALGITQWLYLYRRRLGMAVTSALAGLQGVLGLYLAFG
jgi:hypothetical protein